MIDTAKYEGHTPAPWEIHGDRICAQAACTPVDNVGGNIATVAHKGVLSDNEPNKQLIADAPLFLEEIKRLRESEEQWQTHWEFLRSNWLAHVTTACLSGTDVVKVMDTLRPQDEEAGEEE